MKPNESAQGGGGGLDPAVVLPTTDHHPPTTAQPPATLAEARQSREHIALAHRAPRCVHIKPNGLRCGSPAVKGVPWCYFHDRFFNGSIEENSFPPLDDGNGVQLALMWTLDRLRRDAFRGGETNVPVARTLVYGLQTAAWNLRNTNFDPVLEPSVLDAFPRD